jgi:hypothetical protein
MEVSTVNLVRGQFLKVIYAGFGAWWQLRDLGALNFYGK